VGDHARDQRLPTPRLLLELVDLEGFDDFHGYSLVGSGWRRDLGPDEEVGKLGWPFIVIAPSH
jgi:hypothetical protein